MPTPQEAGPSDIVLQVEAVPPAAGESSPAGAEVLVSASSKQSLPSATDAAPYDLHAIYLSHSKQLRAATPLLLSFFLCILASTGGALLAFCFQHGQGLSSTMASALTGVIANSLQSPFREVMFAGSFAGMSGHEDSGGPFAYEHVCLVGVLVGVVFKALATRFNGAGGKLGTIAFLSGVLVTIPVQLADTDDILVGWKTSAPWKSYDVALFFGAVISSGCGCAVTVALMNKPTPLSSTVLASSVTGLGACALFFAIPSGLVPGLLSPASANVLAMFAYTGSFAGMSAVTRVGSLPRIVLSGFVAGAILLGLWPLFPGIGGKFGFSAMLAVLIVERLPKVPISDSVEQMPEGNTQVDTSKDEAGKDEGIPTTPSKSKLPSKAFVKRKLTLGNLHLAAPRIEDGNDWLTWVPARAWKAASMFIAQGSTRDSANAALIQSYGERHAAQLSALVDRDLDTKAFLHACQRAERIVQPPPKSVCSVESHDATAMHALEVFEALRESLSPDICKDGSVPSKVAMQLLHALDIPALGVQGSDVTPQMFSRAVEDRFGLRARDVNMKHMVRSGLYE